MKLSELLPLIRSLWDALALPLVYALAVVSTIAWATPALAPVFAAAADQAAVVSQTPGLSRTLERLGLLPLLPVATAVAGVALLLALQQVLCAIGGLVPVDVVSRDPARFLRTSEPRLAYFIERLPHVNSPALLQEHLEALTAGLPPELRSQETQWRRKAENYGQHLEVSKALLVLLGVSQIYVAVSNGLGSLDGGRALVAFAFTSLAALFFGMRLLAAYEQIGFAQSTSFFQALMPPQSAVVDQKTREEAARRANRWLNDSAYQGWWYIKVGGYSNRLTWLKRVLGERVSWRSQ